MHLSLLSDGFLSDSVDDAGLSLPKAQSPGQAHREGIVRGLVCMAVGAFLVLITIASGLIHQTEIDAATHAEPASSAASFLQSAQAHGR